MKVISLFPIKICSEANQREYWRVRAKRRKGQRSMTGLLWRSNRELRQVTLPCEITFTRFGVRNLDDDNLASAFKAVRDEIAACLKTDDGRPDIVWRYRQERVKAKDARRDQFELVVEY